ncbi:MAG: VOC family protein [Chthoniobacterales bacterium]
MPPANSSIAIQPYLFFGGRCEEAIEFYRNAVAAELLMLMRYKENPEPEGNMPDCFEEKVMHASMRIGESVVMASDGSCEGPANFDGFSLSVTVPDEEEAERVFAALGSGGLVTMPLAKTFWAPKFGMLTDKFGVGWMVSVMHKADA